MFYDDHNPPHFHAAYEGAEAQYRIDDLSLLAGSITNRAEALVLEWAQMHQDELRDNWGRLHAAQVASKIAPLN